MTTYNIIGDIHGLPAWKSLIKGECINVFVGDFFDPYTYDISYEQCLQNFLEIIEFKKSHPEIVILYGNHELHYFFYGEINERYSRFDEQHAEKIQQLLKDNALYFNGIAYSIHNKYLVTHAGVSWSWYHRWLGRYENQTPDEIATQINNLWELDFRPFLVRQNMKFDCVAEGPTQSPLWLRSWILERNNIFEGTPYIQVFGHTPCAQIKEKDGLVYVDCLRRINHAVPGKDSFIIE